MSTYHKPVSRLIAVVVVTLVGAARLQAFVLGEVYRPAEIDASNSVGVLEVRLSAIF